MIYYFYLDDESVKLAVHGIGPNTKAAALKSHFIRFGKVTGAQILCNKNAEPPRLFGLISMASRSDGDNCIKNLNNTEFEGNAIQIRYYSTTSATRKPPSKHTNKPSNSPLEGDAGGNAPNQPTINDTDQDASTASEPNSQALSNAESQNQSTAETLLGPVTTFPDNERATTPLLPLAARRTSQRARRGRGNFPAGGRSGGSPQNNASPVEAPAGYAADASSGEKAAASSEQSACASARVAERTIAADGGAGPLKIQITINNSKEEPAPRPEPEEEEEEAEDHEPLIVDMAEPVATGEVARLVDPLMGIAEGAFPPLHEPDAPNNTAVSSTATTEQKQAEESKAAADRELNRSAAASTSDRERDKERERRSDREPERGRERERERSRDGQARRHVRIYLYST